MTYLAAVVAPLVLAIMLLVSAVAKWRDQQSTASAITLLRLPRFLQGSWVPKALPTGEALLALALLSPWLLLARLASWAALVLFVLYLAIVARAMTFDPRPSCGCFGRIGDQRINGLTLTRNVLFVLLAILFVWTTARGVTLPALVGGFGGADWAWLAGALALAAATWLVFGTKGIDLSARHASSAPAAQHVSAAAPEPSEGDGLDYLRAPIPWAMLLSQDKTPRTLTELAASKAQLLVFANCFCGPTYAAWQVAESAREDLSAIGVRMVLSLSSPPESTSGLGEPWYDHGAHAWQALGLQQSPSAVLLGADGLLAGGPVAGVAEIETFVDEIKEALGEQPAAVRDEPSGHDGPSGDDGPSGHDDDNGQSSDPASTPPSTSPQPA